MDIDDEAYRNSDDEGSVESLISDDDVMSHDSNIYGEEDIVNDKLMYETPSEKLNITDPKEIIQDEYNESSDLYYGGDDNQYDDSDEYDDDYDDSYLQKLDIDMRKNYIEQAHPECALHNFQEVLALTTISRDKNNNIIDDLHKTIPFLTKYEKTRILGQRAKQINAGSKPFVKHPSDIIDGYLIAELELQQKKIPFIIRRPLPNGGTEYWKVSDLEVLV